MPLPKFKAMELTKLHIGTGDSCVSERPAMGRPRYAVNGDQRKALAATDARAQDTSADGKSVTLVVDSREPYYVHELRLDGVRNRESQSLLHPVGYYTLNRIPK